MYRRKLRHPPQSHSRGSGLEQRGSLSAYDYQRNCRVLSEVLNRFVVGGVQSPRGAGGICSIESRAMATLYSLLTEHPIDEWGRCRFCRHPAPLAQCR